MTEHFITAGVMGWPVAHSRSPLIHNYWISEYRLQGTYGLFPVEPNHLEAAIRGLSALGIAGCNITIPHKIDAIKFVDWVDPAALKVGAINTIVRQTDGKLHGYNNDGYGYIQSVKEAAPHWQANNGPIVVLGAGGAARAILVALAQEGAQEIRLLNRTFSKAQELAHELGAPLHAYSWNDRHSALEGAALLINTTSQGMQGYPELDIDLTPLPPQAMVSDIIYTPLETALLKNARQRGHLAINGLGMLIHQARPAFHAWFGVFPDVTQSLYTKILRTL